MATIENRTNQTATGKVPATPSGRIHALPQRRDAKSPRPGGTPPFDPSRLVVWTVRLAAGVLLAFLIMPLVAIVHRVWSEAGGANSGTWQTLRDSLQLTLWTTSVSLLVIVALGTPLAYLLARKSFRGKALVETLIDLPMVLPPAVAGLALLMAFGRRGLVGETLDGWGISIGFTSIAVIMAQIFVASPFFVRAARAGFARSDRELEEAAADLGATPARVLRSVTLPLAKSSLAAGSVLAWARAVGEFGATIIFAGSIAGTTQTMPLAIYGRYEAGDLETALVLAVLLLGASMLVLLAVRLTGGQQIVGNRQ